MSDPREGDDEDGQLVPLDEVEGRRQVLGQAVRRRHDQQRRVVVVRQQLRYNRQL